MSETPHPGTRLPYVSPLLAKNFHMKPDPASLPPAGRQDTLRGDPGSAFRRRKDRHQSYNVHVTNGATTKFDSVSLAQASFPTHTLTKRIHMSKGLGNVVLGTEPATDPADRCGIGRSIPDIMDTRSWASVKQATVDEAAKARGPARSSLQDSKRSAWAEDKQLVRGTSRWAGEMRSTLGSQECYQAARTAAVARQQQLGNKAAGVGHTRYGVASAPYATDV
jgi:hypothetical protein